MRGVEKVQGPSVVASEAVQAEGMKPWPQQLGDGSLAAAIGSLSSILSALLNHPLRC